MKKHEKLANAITSAGYLDEYAFCKAAGITQGGHIKDRFLSAGIRPVCVIPEFNKEGERTREKRFYSDEDVSRAARYCRPKKMHQAKKIQKQITDEHQTIADLTKQLEALQNQVADLQRDKQNDLF